MKEYYCGFIPDPHGQQLIHMYGLEIKGYWLVAEDTAGMLKEATFEVVSNCAFDI